MAFEPTAILGTETLLLIDTTTSIDTDIDLVAIPGNFEPVGCLSSNSWESSTTTTDTSSKCSGRFTSSLPGDKSATASGEGFAISDSDAITAGLINHNQLAVLDKNSTIVWLAMFDTALNTIRYGKAFITAYSDSAPRAEGQTFSVSFQIVGEWNVAVPTT